MTSAARLATVLFVVFVLLALPQRALAAPPITVGTGTPASCTEWALRDALAIADTVGGGTISFQCGQEPVSIELRELTRVGAYYQVLLVIPHNTTIDGGGLITLDGLRRATVAFVDEGSTVVLKGLIITGGVYWSPEVQYSTQAGGILNRGHLTLDHTLVTGNFGMVGGGVYAYGGALILEHSSVSGNAANVYAGGIYSGGPLTIRHSHVDHNGADWDGGIAASGPTLIEHSTVIGNVVSMEAGGIANYGAMTIRHSTIAENGSRYWFGGGLMNWGTLEIDQTTFADNEGGYAGAALVNIGDATITRSTFTGNRVLWLDVGRGGAIFNGGALTLERDTFTQNIAGSGGDLYVCLGGGYWTRLLCDGSVTLTRTTLDILEEQP